MKIEITEKEINLLCILRHDIQEDFDAFKTIYGDNYSSHLSEDIRVLTELIQKVVPNFV